MDIIYWLLPLILLAGVVMVGFLFWTIKSGQYEDMEGNAGRIIMEDEEKTEN